MTHPPQTPLHSLFRAHYGEVVAWARALGAGEAAEDVAQQTFVTAFRHLSAGEGEIASPRAWLYSIVRGMAANARRGESRRRRRGEALGEQAPLLAAVPADPEQVAERRERARILQRFLDGLPEDVRMAFVLYEIQGMTAAEAAEILGTSPAKIHGKVRRARARLERFCATHRARVERERKTS